MQMNSRRMLRSMRFLCLDEGRQLTKWFTAWWTRKTIKYNNLIETLTSHFDPKPSSIVQRFKFYNRSRGKGESIATYVATLHAIAEHCEYGDSLKIMLRDKLVCGINHQGIQWHLLSEKNLTYENALEIALIMEAAAKDTKDLQGVSSAPAAQLHYVAAGNIPGKFKGSDKATQSLYNWPQNPQHKSQTSKKWTYYKSCRSKPTVPT